MDRKRLEAVERLLDEQQDLQPTPDSEALESVLPAIVQDLSERRTTFVAEAIARHLLYGSLMAYAGVVTIRKGGLMYAGRGYREWLDGLIMPMLLLDQAFAVFSQGPAQVLASIDSMMSSRDFHPQAPPGPWGYELLRKKVTEASRRLRMDASGLGMLAWFLEDQIEQCDLYCAAGMVACTRLYVLFLAEVKAKGYSDGGLIYGTSHSS